MSEAQDLNTLIDAPTWPVINGESIEIRTIKVRNLPKVMAVLEPLKDQLIQTINLDPNNPGAEVKLPSIDFLGLVTKHTDAVITVLAGMLDREEDWVADLDPAQLIELLERTVGVNLDFFIERFIPSLSGALVRLNAQVVAKLPAGSTPSKS